MTKDEMIAELAKHKARLDTLDGQDKYAKDCADIVFKKNEAERVNINARIFTLEENLKNIKEGA